MRPLNVLVTSAPALNHLWDVVPIAWALRSRGHEVRVATLPHLAQDVVETSLTALSAGPLRCALPVTRLDGYGARLRPPGRASVRMSAELARDLIDAAGMFRPDLVLHEPAELAGPVVAERLGVPRVEQGWPAPLPASVCSALRLAAQDLRRELAMAPSGPPPELFIDVRPPSWRARAARPPAGRWQPMRYVPYLGPGEVPSWLGQAAGRRRACLALDPDRERADGTPLIAVVVEALSARTLSTREQPGAGLDLVVPVSPYHPGRAEIDRALGSRARVVDWQPLPFLADQCDLIVHHGDPALALTCLVSGVPQLVLPQTAEETVCAELVADEGAGRAEPGRTATAALIRGSAHALLADDRARRAARRLGAQIAAQPAPASVAAVVEDLVAARTWA